MSNQDNEKPVATNLAQPQQETPLSFIVLPGQNQLGQPVNPQPNQPMMAQPMQPMMGQPMMQQQNQPMMGQPMVQNQPIMYQYGQMQGQPVVQGQVQQMAYVQPQYIIHPNQQANVINIGDAQILVPGLGNPIMQDRVLNARKALCERQLASIWWCLLF
jgi:hypothetical protein